MSPSWGSKIGEGATAEVFAWSPGQIVKLYRSGVPHQLCRHEARMTRAVFLAGGVAPQVFHEVTIDGRHGLIMAHLDGPTLTHVARRKQVSFAEAGVVLATVLHSVHATPPPPTMPPLRDYLTVVLGRAPASLSKTVIAGIFSSLDSLAGDGLCHGDPNPGNVIMTVLGPRLIDWVSAMRAPPAFDLASAQIILGELAPTVADDPERPRAINAALQTEYARVIGTSAAALTASMQPYLPVVRALLLLGGGARTHEAELVRRLNAEFLG
jgi:Ser/Thr protein kinase RdoA (MazF antagonist)